jgi:hypothetical protein
MVMVQGRFDRCLPSEMGVDLPRPFPQKEAPDVAGKVLAGFKRTAKTAIEDKSEEVSWMSFPDLAHRNIFRPEISTTGMVRSLEGPAHPAPRERPGP